MSDQPSPFFSVLTPVYSPDLAILRATIASVVDQSEPDWELILVDDASPDPGVIEVLRHAAADDPRIRVVERAENGHIVAASNDAVQAARGEFLALLDHDDLLAVDALLRVRHALELHDDVDYLYTDEDKVEDSGRTFDRFAKPGWSPERLRGQMYTGHLSVLRASLVREVGGFHAGFEGSQDHDLVLRVTERARRIVHLPEVLYHWRATAGSTAQSGEAKPYAWDAGVQAVQAHVDRTGLEARVERGRQYGTYRVVREVPADSRISVVIPTRGSAALVWGEWRCLVLEAVRSLVEVTRAVDLEIVVVHDDDHTPQPVLDQLGVVAGSALRLVPFSGRFNFSQKCNVGALAAQGDLLVFLNDDIETMGTDLIGALCAPLSDPTVGITGAKLVYADMTIQHAGLALRGSDYHHAHRGLPLGDPGPFNALEVSREVSALTAAAIAVRRSTFEDIGGFSEALPVNFNDVDLCLKASRLGYRQLWVHDAEAFHFESQTRLPQVEYWEHEVMTERWGRHHQDPYLMRESSYRSGT